MAAVFSLAMPKALSSCDQKLGVGYQGHLEVDLEQAQSAHLLWIGTAPDLSSSAV